MKQFIPLSLLLCIFFSCQSKQNVLQVDVTEEVVQPKQYIIGRCNEEITVDGKANEACWKSALFTDSFIDIEGEKIPKYDTQVKMLWDDQFLYIFAQLEEPHIWGDIQQRDEVIFYNNDFEVFINPTKSTQNYGEIEINALGTVWDLLLDKPYRNGGKANNHWNLDRLETAIHIEGTLNNDAAIDSFWTVEMAIPMAALLELKVKPQTLPKEGEQWRINFSRVQWDHAIENGVYQRKQDENGKYLPEYNWVWSNQGVINMHEPEKWGTVQFTHKLLTQDVSFITEKDRDLEQVAFALFRNTRKGKLKDLLEKPMRTQLKLEVKYQEAATVEATFYKTNMGFEYVIVNPNTSEQLMINEAGVLKRVK